MRSNPVVCSRRVNVGRLRQIGARPLVLGLAFVALGLVSDSLYAVAAGSVGGLLRRRRRALRYCSGTAYIGLGVVAALARRA